MWFLSITQNTFFILFICFYSLPTKGKMKMSVGKSITEISEITSAIRIAAIFSVNMSF